MARQTLVMVDRAGRPEHTPEAEPLLVEVDGDAVTCVFDDGESFSAPRAVLLDALVDDADATQRQAA